MRIAVAGLMLVSGMVSQGPVHAQTPPEEYERGYNEGVADAACEVARIVSTVLVPAVASNPRVGSADFTVMMETLRGITQECAVTGHVPRVETDHRAAESLYGLRDENAPPVLPPDRQRRIRHATCRELERRLHRMEDSRVLSLRDRAYQSAVTLELQWRCW